MKRITREKKLTPEQAAKYEAAREELKKEYPPETLNEGLWTIPATDGAASALRDWHRLINPLIIERAQRRCEERGERLGILRADVEAAIIEDLARAVECQAIRIRDLTSEKCQLEGALEELRSAVLPKKAELIACPCCGKKVTQSAWTHPDCGKCGHGNAMINGVCRDCDYKDPSLKDRVQYQCNACKHIFLKP
jgi:hypothetical protein